MRLWLNSRKGIIPCKLKQKGKEFLYVNGSKSFENLNSVRLWQKNTTVRKDPGPGNLFIYLNIDLLDLAKVKFKKSSTVTNASTDEIEDF